MAAFLSAHCFLRLNSTEALLNSTQTSADENKLVQTRIYLSKVYYLTYVKG